MRSIKEMDKRLDEREQEIERLNNLLKKTSQTLSEQTTKAITLKSENERLKNVIKRITEINNQKIKIINDIMEYMNTNVNDNINHIYEILEGDKE